MSQDVSAPQLAERGQRVRGGRWSVPGFPLHCGRAALQTRVCQPFPLLPQDLSKSPKTMKKLLPKRRPEWKLSDKEFALRKNTAALEEDAQILKVIKAYCTSTKTWQTFNSSSCK